jgi:hypothetical protein
MTNEQKFELCLRQAESITQSYRRMSPRGHDPKNWYVSTTLIVLALVSAAVSAAGAMSSAQAQSDAAKYNSVIAKNNAQSAAQQGQFDAQQIRDKNRRILASQRSAFAANGGEVDSGSAADVSADSAQQGEMQALMAIYTGKTSATAYEAQSKLQAMQAGNAMTAGYIGVGSSIIGGVASAGMMDAQSKNPTFIK